MPNPSELRRAIVASFNLDELDLLCADLDATFAEAGLDVRVSLERIGAMHGSIEVRVQRLIEYLVRRDCLAALVAAVRQARPGRL